MEPQEDKYKLFLDWFVNNGGKYDKDSIKYPVYYEPGKYPGVGALKSIPRNRVIVAIPFNLIITVNRVKHQLKQLYEDVYKQEDEEVDDLEFLVLTLYLTYEKQKGKQSFFYPYFNIVPLPENMCDWNSSQIVQTQDPYIMGMVNEEKQQLPLLFDSYRIYTTKYKNLFKHPVTMKQFLWSLNFVQTRCYGWGFPQTLLAPFADLFNHHSQQTVNHYTFKGKYQSGQQKPHPSYIIKADCLNIQLLGIKSRQAKKYQPNERIKTLIKFHPQIDQNQLVQKQEYYWNEYLKSNLLIKPFQTQILQEDDDEDNDTEDEDEQQPDNESFESKIEVLKIKQNPPESYKSLLAKQFVRPSLPINREFQQEVDFQWYNFQDKDTYFIVSTGNDVQAGEQLFNSYGQRNNRFLLVWYGFSLCINRFHSVPFKLLLESKSSHDELQIYQKYITSQQEQQGIKIKGKKRIAVQQYLTQQFRLKQSKLCQKLIMYLRFKLLKKHSDFERKVTFPTNLHHEIQMLTMYQTILHKLQLIYNTQTLQQDKEQLKKSSTQLKDRHIFAIVHRICNKQIVQIQLSLVQIAKDIIYDLIDKKDFKLALNTARKSQKDQLFDNTEGRVFYIKKIFNYVKPLTYLTN